MTKTIMGIECDHSPATEELCEAWHSPFRSKLDVQVTLHSSGTYSLRVGVECLGDGRSDVSLVVWEQPSIEDAEREWFAVARREAPGLHVAAATVAASKVAA